MRIPTYCYEALRSVYLSYGVLEYVNSMGKKIPTLYFHDDAICLRILLLTMLTGFLLYIRVLW